MTTHGITEMIKGFRYKVPRASRYNPANEKPKVSKPTEVLSGFLQGHTVPADEQRFFIGAIKTRKVRTYYSQFQIGARGLPGYRTLDVLVNTNFGWRGFEIDGITFVHRNAATKAEDRLKDFQRVSGLKSLGIDLRRGIEHVPDSKLQTQEDADRTTRNLL